MFYHRPVRLAWFTPLPPVRSGISDYSAEILPLLAADHAIDVFVATAAGRADRPGVAVYSAHDFVWRHRRRLRPHRLPARQRALHDYMWAYLAHYPGLLVLHDAALHHARAALLLRDEREADYRAELAANHPDLDPSVAEIAIGGVSGPLYYFWPMVAVPARASRGQAHRGSPHCRAPRQSLML